MGGFPAWAIPYILLKGGEAVGDAATQGMKLFDWHKQQGNEREAADAARDFGLADNPQDVQEIMYGLGSRYKVKDPTTISALRTQGQGLIDRFKKDQQETAYKSGVGKLVQFVKDNPDQPIGSALTALNQDEAAAFGTAMKGGADDFLKSFAVGRAEVAKTAADKEKAANVAGFQSAIGGLDAPSKSPNDLSRFAQRGGYAPISDVTSDIRQAAAAYNVGDSDEVNKAIQRAEETYNKTMLPPVSGKIGGKPYTGQYNLMGDFRKDAEDKSTTVVNNMKISTAPPADAVASDAQAVLEGRLALSALSKRNGHDARVRAAVLKMNPNFNFTQAEANAKFVQNPSLALSTVNLKAVEPLLGELENAHKGLNNGNLTPINSLKIKALRLTGDQRVTAYDNLRNNLILEVTRAMQGSGQMSDERVKMESQNLYNAQSPAQMKAAIANIEKIIGARKEANQSVPFPAATGKGGGGAKAPITPQQAAAELARRRAAKGGR